MVQLNIYEAKAQLSKLIQKALNGEKVIISKAGKPLVVLKPIDQRKRQLGLLKGQIGISEDFDDSSPEIEKLFS